MCSPAVTGESPRAIGKIDLAEARRRGLQFDGAEEALLRVAKSPV